MKPLDVKEWMIFGRPFNQGLSDEKFVLQSNGMSLDDAVGNIDEVFTDYMFRLRDKHGDTGYALGLSGGWDSRVVLHYAIQAGITPKLFFMGDPRPYGFWDSFCFDAAKKICKVYNLDLPKVIPFVHRPNKKLILSDLERDTYGFYHIWRYHVDHDELPDHEILLSGLDGGESFGQSIPFSINHMTNLQTTYYLLNKIGKLNGPVDGVLHDDEFQHVFNRLHAYCCVFDQPVNSVESFLFGFYSLNNRLFRSMSPFHSDEYRGLVATWNPDWFKGLRLQRRLFNTFIPELAGIHSQKKHPPFTTDRGTIRHQLESLFYQNMRLLRGSMTDYSNIVYHPDFKKFMFEVFTCKNDEFDSLFDTQKIIGLFHQAAHLNCKWWLNLLKIKLFFDEVK